jgi:hypothetical protein
VRRLTFRPLLIVLGAWAVLSPHVDAAAAEDIAGLCRADALFVSDNPEAVRETRGLFYADTGGARCIRLLYHHENANPDSPIAIQAWALAEGDAGVDLRMTAGTGGPTPEAMTAGHRAIVKFWQAVLSNAGRPMHIGPHRWQPLVETVLRPHDVVSGLAQLQIAGGPLAIVVVAYLPGASEANIAPASFLKRAGTHPFGVFTAPRVENHWQAQVDRPRGLLLAAGGFLTGRRAGEALKGNYGVIYRLRVDCINNSDRPILLILALSPQHGPAAGTFVINGRLIDVGPTQRGAYREVARYWIPPGTWPLDIWATPEGASAYPVRLDFLPAGPES